MASRWIIFVVERSGPQLMRVHLIWADERHTIRSTNDRHTKEEDEDDKEEEEKEKQKYRNKQ